MAALEAMGEVRLKSLKSLKAGKLDEEGVRALRALLRRPLVAGHIVFLGLG